jgi:hypothetical protein
MARLVTDPPGQSAGVLSECYSRHRVTAATRLPDAHKALPGTGTYAGSAHAGVSAMKSRKAERAMHPMVPAELSVAKPQRLWPIDQQAVTLPFCRQRTFTVVLVISGSYRAVSRGRWANP